MKLIAEAHTNKEIAEILHLSEKTVESHRGDGCCRSSACATASSWCATRSGAGSSSPSDLARVTSAVPGCVLLVVVARCWPWPTAVLAAIAARARTTTARPRSSRRSTSSGVEGPRSPFKGAAAAEGAAAATSRCATRTGELVQPRDLRGTVVVLSPIYTTCDETRARSPHSRSGARSTTSRATEREGVRALALSVDPANDTPDAARRVPGRPPRERLPRLPARAPQRPAAGLARLRLCAPDRRSRSTTPTWC